MKPSSALPACPVVSPAKAWTCLVINQTATPGLGSVTGRRFLAGTGQLLLSGTGFVLIVFWMFRALFQNPLREAMGEPVLPSCAGAGNWGAVLFGASWLWSWVTSLSLLREAQRHAPPPPRTPPLL
jgi:hypothetical protein